MEYLEVKHGKTKFLGIYRQYRNHFY